MSLLTPSLRDTHHDSESAYGECGSENKAHDHDLHKTVGVAKHQNKNIEEPYIVEQAVEQDIIHI